MCWVNTLEVVRDPVALAALTPEWRALWERCPGATPFQTPEWLLPWQHRLGGGHLHVLAVRREGYLTSLLPLQESGWPRRYSLLGAGVSDYLDILIVAETTSESGACLRDWLSEALRRGAAFDFDQLRADSALLAWELPTARHHWQREPCPLLALPPTLGELHSRWSSSLRKHVAYARRRLERVGSVIELATEATLDETLTVLFQAHQQRWNRRLLPGAFARPAVRAFHREAAAGFLGQGMLRLYALRLEGRVVAALYCFAGHGRCCYYAAGFQTDIQALSPGTLLIAHALEDAVLRGDTEFDFLRGNEPYKYRWGAEDRLNQRVLHAPRTLAGAWLARTISAELVMEAKAKRLADRWLRR